MGVNGLAHRGYARRLFLFEQFFGHEAAVSAGGRGGDGGAKDVPIYSEWIGTLDGFLNADIIAAGFRVIVPDEIGFGRSSKPIIPYNFNDMAANVHKLLVSRGVAKAVIVGHSMGGMFAARFAASYPDMTERLVLYDPIGLTDPRYKQPFLERTISISRL